jgi:hypothetical protein
MVKVKAKAKARAKGAARKAAAKRPNRSTKCTGANCGKKPWEGLAEFARKKGFRVTSTTGGRHNPGSAHYEGRAIDVGTREKTSAEVESFMTDARAAGIDVRDERARPPGQKVWGGPHVHLSVPRGTNFPPCC